MIVEDDKTTANELKVLLENNNYKANILENFQNALDEILASSADLVLLDMNIPCIDGKTLLEKLRKRSCVPVIMVTSATCEIDEALCISYGADDYVTKPYNPNILLLRIKAVLKRVYGGNVNPTYKGLIVNIEKGQIAKGEKTIILTKNEMIIFSYLLNHQNKIVTRDELMSALWDRAEFIGDSALTVNISRLRTKLKELGYEQAIDTRKGIGYILL